MFGRSSSWVCGLMDKAPDFGFWDCRFKFYQAWNFFPNPCTLCSTETKAFLDSNGVKIDTQTIV